MILKRGDHVRVTASNRSVVAMVTMASPNGRSIILMFDAVLGGWVGAMPAFEADDGTWAALDGMPLSITMENQ